MGCNVLVGVVIDLLPCHLLPGKRYGNLLKNEGIMNFSLQYPYKLVN